jgi:hypothetical protein
MLRATVRRTSLLQAAAAIIGTAMALQAAHCGLIGHHGRAILSTIGAAINYLSFETAARTCALAGDALDLSVREKPTARHPHAAHIASKVQYAAWRAMQCPSIATRRAGVSQHPATRMAE